MDIIEYEGITITVYDGDITTLPPDGLVIYGEFGRHMLGIVEKGKLKTLNAIPYQSINALLTDLKKLSGQGPHH
ncbi:hypothetical protein EKN56_05540 [Limnobaculum zhutongyuii]|uniref:Uncharacterized protein n=1 Tax=Limnobaculum zhutongyuii TaxID=2498113 RepID=A0A411WIA5_9GAMM|nr:hypothetical protein [Limnobaculum zhutongyuii]QBH95911.1 hypothetical protein EKN56_05540 [Limnobaculum zhutongyuii]TQS89380.1 hypothetical protein ELQ32_06390 [Limnobaculum zhutongyuii]